MNIKLELSKKTEDHYNFNMPYILLARLINAYMYKDNYNRSIFRDKRYKRFSDNLTAEVICSSYPIDNTLIAYIYLYNKANNLIGSCVCYSNNFTDKLFNYYSITTNK